MVIMCTPTSSRHQKVIRKLNNIVIVRLTKNRRPNLPSNIWGFNTSMNWKMLGAKFETWPADSPSEAIFVKVGMYVTNLGYLEERSPCFTELPDRNTEESNRILIGLDIVAVIPETNDQDPLDLIDSEVE